MSNALQVTSVEGAMKLATVLANSELIPKHFRGKVADCFILVETANRLQMPLLQVAQNLYVVHGTPGWSGKFCKALIDGATWPNGQRRYTKVRYEYQRDKAGVMMACRLLATEYDRDRETGEVIEGTWVTWDAVVAEGWNQDKKNREGGTTKSKWNTIREQMFHYRAASFFYKAHCPGAGFGISIVDELEDAGDVADAIAPARAEQLPPVPAIDRLKLIDAASSFDELKDLRASDFSEAEKDAWKAKYAELKAEEGK